MSKFTDHDDASLWSAHHGGPIPVQTNSIVVVRYRCGAESVVEAGKRRWQRWPDEIGESDWDIVAWRASTEHDI